MSKLVRDRIPEIIQRKDGTRPVTRNATRFFKGASITEHRQVLLDKLQEEVDEFIEDQGVEELADILEVVYALCGDIDEDLSRLEAVRHGKAVARGGFENGIILL